MWTTLTALVVAAVSMLAGPAAGATAPPVTPEPVADYFATGLVPRLIDLYGSGNGVTSGIDFDATTKVGAISRVSEWTPDFLAGRQSDPVTRVTNNWVASVSVRGAVIGLATVWINPSTDAPELATFDSPDLAIKLAGAPAKSILVHDTAQQAWFAMTGDTLTPLVTGSSGVTGPTTAAEYQKTISVVEPVTEPGISGVAISALVLGVVILGLAIFVLLPVGRRSSRGDPDISDESDVDSA
jgi:hypothetical protein